MTNCLFFALALWWRRLAKGKRCYISIRQSDSGRFPHFLFCEWRAGSLRILSYKPISPIDRKCPPCLFEGRVRWGDPAPKHNIKR